MDLLITKGNTSVKLSDYGLYNITVADGSPAISIDKRSVSGRNGNIYGGAVFTAKTIKVSGRFSVDSPRAAMEKQDELNGLLLDDEPFFITKMYPNKAGFYDFQVPGQTTGDLDVIRQPHTAWKYRYKVVASSEIDFRFVGNSGQGLKYDISMTFTTTDLPFGMTIPKTLTLNGGAFDYAGTAKLSQLEWPFVVEMTADGNQSGFYLEISGKRFEYSQVGNINPGDVFRLTGIETTKNRINVNAKTNYGYFVISPTLNKKITYKTNFNGTIKLLNFVELYK
ncbi:hypothetical protein Javan173_0008 [Streptococcus phage Javan173]|uniref:phage tail domain-containing protein n=1 Tax=Streptococcus entericus TaxID=155680 RepID=UPI0003720E6D|nr:phage tail domain-containing protein [Streptococcus entericus]QBX15137.1 hypothetical protein Javan173_0008 [Streptococcus phage Javan173]